MKKAIKWLMLAMIFTVTACGTSESLPSTSGGEGKELTTKQEVTDGDFVYRLVTEKAQYDKDEDVILYAELEYIGDDESIKIYHAASPFYFNIYEKTRDYYISYAMNEPLIETELKKDEPLREDYRKSGAYSEHDDKKYVDFMKEFWQGKHFPTGEYEVEGLADFFIYADEKKEETKNYRIKAEVAFKVK